MEVSILGLGTVKFGRTAGARYAAPFELPSDDDIAELLATAQSLGINLLDTAPAYGTSETRLGAALAGQRAAWIIATKTGEEFDGVKSRFDFSADPRFEASNAPLRASPPTASTSCPSTVTAAMWATSKPPARSAP